MLSTLYIENIAVIEKASIDFEQGLTVLTGETGAGKSIIIDAIHAVLGERTSKELIRTDANSASVSALFTDLKQNVVDILAKNNIPFSDDELLIKREIKQSKSVSKANGVPITAAILRDIGKELISIHGQHDSYDLLTPEVHGRYIDVYGNCNELLEEYKLKYQRLRGIKSELDKLNIDEAQKARRIDLLTYQIDEITGANIKVGERDELTELRNSIRNGEAIMSSINSAKAYLLGDDDAEGASSQITLAAEALEAVEDNYPSLKDIASKLRDCEYLLEDISAEVRDLSESFEFDPTALDNIEARLDELYRLSLKYGESEMDILDFCQKANEELTAINLSDEKIEILSEEFEQVKKDAIRLAKALSEKRKQASKSFADSVKNQLKFLNMPNVEFCVSQERVNLNSLGCDKIQFLVSANPGEEPKPMSKIASGGELSRIMLSIKTVLSSGDNIDTLIFDEVDTGISGEAAHKVGLKLKEAAASRQVICITHLAQMAAMAENQMLIEKKTDGTKTFTSVNLLDYNGRLNELARLIGGDGITPLKLKMAEELLQNS